MDSRDQNHRHAVPVFRSILRKRLPLAMTSCILSEVLTYARRLGGLEVAARVMDFFLALLASGQLRLHHLTANEFMAAYQTFAQVNEKSFSFPDATLVWLGEQSGARSVFGYDRAFSTRGLDLLG